MNRVRRSASVGTVILCAAVASVARAADPTNDEQYSLELINRMRIEPLRELQRMVNINPPTATSPATWGPTFSDDPDIDSAIDFFLVDADFLWNQWQQLVPAPALAWNSNLNDSAIYHNSRMIFHNAQEHEFGGEPGLVERIEARGYTDWQTLGENIFAYAEGALYAHAGFAIDWGLLDDFGEPIPPGIQDPPGHRFNIMDPDFRDIGIAITPQQKLSDEDVGPLVITHDFGAEFNKSYITGVHYNDDVQRDSFYTPGEGNGNVTVTAYVPGTSTVVAATTTTSSGGYKLDLPAGTYDIAFGNAAEPREMIYRNVVKGTANLKLDSFTTWIRDGDGSWHDPRNWFAGVPNGEGTVASLYDVATAPRSINVTTPVTVGTINFENPSGYRIAGPGVISIDVSVNFRGQINVIGAGAHEIVAGLATVDGVDVSVDQGGTLTLSGPLSLSRQFNKHGPGTLNIDGPQTNMAGAELVLRGGTTNIRTNAGTLLAPVAMLLSDLPGAVVNLQSTQHLRAVTVGNQAQVNLTPGGGKVLYIKRDGAITPLLIDQAKLDLNDNAMIVQSNALSRDADLATVVGHVRSARNAAAGQWQGNGIMSSAASQNDITGLAAMLNPGLATFAGETVDENAILVMYTYNGDGNLDGRINFDDYFLIDSAFLTQPQNPTYRDGDFNFDGRINFDDYFLIDSAFLGQGGPLATPLTAIAAVPEPGGVLLALGAAAILMRRRR